MPTMAELILLGSLESDLDKLVLVLPSPAINSEILLREMFLAPAQTSP